jgi:hypothetical protein
LGACASSAHRGQPEGMVLKTFLGSNSLHEVSCSQSSNSLTLLYLERDEANLAVATSPTDKMMPDIMVTKGQLPLPLINQNDDDTGNLYATSTAGTSPEPRITVSGLSMFSSQQPPTLSEPTYPSSHRPHTLERPPTNKHLGALQSTSSSRQTISNSRTLSPNEGSNLGPQHGLLTGYHSVRQPMRNPGFQTMTMTAQTPSFGTHLPSANMYSSPILRVPSTSSMTNAGDTNMLSLNAQGHMRPIVLWSQLPVSLTPVPLFPQAGPSR